MEKRNILKMTDFKNHSKEERYIRKKKFKESAKNSDKHVKTRSDKTAGKSTADYSPYDYNVAVYVPIGYYVSGYDNSGNVLVRWCYRITISTQTTKKAFDEVYKGTLLFIDF